MSGQNHLYPYSPASKYSFRSILSDRKYYMYLHIFRYRCIHIWIKLSHLICDGGSSINHTIYSLFFFSKPHNLLYHGEVVKTKWGENKTNWNLLATELTKKRGATSPSIRLNCSYFPFWMERKKEFETCRIGRALAGLLRRLVDELAQRAFTMGPTDKPDGAFTKQF